MAKKRVHQYSRALRKMALERLKNCLKTSGYSDYDKRWY